MWDDHRLLNQVAAMLTTLAVLVMAYAAVVLIARLPVFALERIRISARTPPVSR
jgi:hypothetical protein